MLVILTRSFQWRRIISVIGLYVKSWAPGRVYFLSALENLKKLVVLFTIFFLHVHIIFILISYIFGIS